MNIKVFIYSLIFTSSSLVRVILKTEATVGTQLLFIQLFLCLLLLHSIQPTSQPSIIDTDTANARQVE